MPNKNPNPKAKMLHDFAALKKEFFLSKYLEVAPFFREMHKEIHTRWHESNTVGWAAEKKEWKMHMVDDALKEVQGFETRENAKALSIILSNFRKKLSKEDMEKMSIKDLKRLWEIFMTMNGRVTKITKQLSPTDVEQPEFNYSEDAKKRLEKYTKPSDTQAA